MSNSFFELHKTCDGARRGTVTLAHGKVETPVFMPVATTGAIKSLLADDLEKMDAKICLANTYHMYLRPGTDTIKKFEGLHKFMNWKRPILTDSGGFQVFSLSKLRELDEEGVTFRSHLSGEKIHFTPESVVETQEIFESDIHMVLDECTEVPATYERTEDSMRRSMRWAKRARVAKKKTHLAQFGICQGGMYESLRNESCDALVEIGFDGYAIGGLSVGESKDMMRQMTQVSCQRLPNNSARYLMGVGTPLDLLESVALGVDMFDCVMPARNARRGSLFTSIGKVQIKNAKHKNDMNPLDPNCECYTCQNYSLAFLRHMYNANEPSSYRLLTLHNLTYYLKLMDDIRKSIESDTFLDLLSHHQSLWAAKSL